MTNQILEQTVLFFMSLLFFYFFTTTIPSPDTKKSPSPKPKSITQKGSNVTGTETLSGMEIVDFILWLEVNFQSISDRWLANIC